MTMHMIQGVQVHGNSRKKKQPTKAELQKLQTEWRQYNKRMRQSYMHDCQFSEFKDYVAYTRGEYKSNSKKQEFKTYEPPKTYHRETPTYSSYSSKGKPTPGYAAKQEPKQYTGTLIKGIGTMHKSNAIPVIDEQQMKDLASMRR